MPKNTFFNLSHEKREKIIECSKYEFSKYGFYNSSINRIIKECHISRGSFYQYFEDKEDLYIYLLNDFTDFMIKNIIAKINNKKYDIFELQLIIFDYITLEFIKSEDKDFIISIISNMDIKLANKMMNFIKVDQSFISFINLENISINNSSEFISLLNILIVSLTNELVSYFTNMKDLNLCRESLISTSNLIKYGVIKRN